MKTSVMIGGEEEERMEGWLYSIRSNRFGLQSSRRRYFVLQDHVFKCFKSIPSSDHESPVRSVIIDSCIRVTGSGRESIHRKVFFIFSLYNTSNHNDQLKLGASSPEEAARWIHSFKEAALKSGSNVGCSKNYWQSFRYDKHIQHCYRNSSSSWVRSIGWTLCSSTCRDSVIDVIAPSTWTIFGCHNGLRLFEEAKDRDSRGKWDDHPAIMAVGVVDTNSEAIFQTLMSLGPSRSEWDFCFYKGSVVEHLDGHTDIVHKQLYGDWLPWGMKRRDFLLRRCWRREDDGKYVILYHSVFHKNCPPQKGYVRACLKSGGYVISPLNQGERSVVKHMLVIDWKFWKSYIQTSSAQSITIRMLGRVAALRELFIAKRGNCPPDFSSGELDCNILDGPTSPTEATTKAHTSEEVDTTPSNHASLVGPNNAADEFFDVPEPSDDERTGNGWSYAYSPEIYPQVPRNKLFIV